MAKNQKNTKGSKSPSSIKHAYYPILSNLNTNTFIFNKWVLYSLLFVVTLLVYANTIFHDYTLDDVIVITKNNFTMKGFGGIKDILTKDTFEGYTTVKNLVAGGRYRPLSVVSFAIEIGLFGKGHPEISHFGNVLLYALLIVLLFKFFNTHIFRNNILMSLLAIVVFAIHPIHTEVVANIKSRDEIMATVFMILSLQLFFDYQNNTTKRALLVVSLVCFFLSLMSKESVITYNAIVPLLFYFFYGKDFKESILKSLPFVLVTILFLMMRFSITGVHSSLNNDILNAPYLYATPVEAFATKTWILLRYLWLLFFPHPLTYDYTYNQIPYIKISSIKFLSSVLINGMLLMYALKKMKEKSIISFSILVYFIGLSIAANFAFDIGAPMGERFLFQSSLGFAMFFAFIVFSFSENGKWLDIKKRRAVSIVFVSIVLVLGTVKTIARNSDWKNEDVLYIVDGKVSPNSAHATMNSAVSYVNLANKATDTASKNMYFKMGITQFKKAVTIYPKFADAYINMGATYYMLKNVDSTAYAWEMGRLYSPGHPLLPGYFSVLSNMCYNEGLKYYEQKNIDKAIEYYTKALKYNEKNTDAMYNLGGTYLSKGNVNKARELWTHLLQLKPNHTEAKKWLSQLPH